MPVDVGGVSGGAADWPGRTRGPGRVPPAPYGRRPAMTGLSVHLRTALCRGEEAEPDVYGYRLAEAASGGTFPEVAYLLLHGGLPDADRLADFHTLLVDAAEVPPVIRELTEELPLHVTPGQTLRTVVSLLGEFDGQAGRCDPAAVRTQAVDLMARLPLVFAAPSLAEGGKTPGPSPDLSFGADLVRLLTGRRPSDAEEVAFEADLVLAANPAPAADVLAARLAAARGADLFGVVTAALCGGDGPPGDDASDAAVELEEVKSAVARCVARVPVWAAHAMEQVAQLSDERVESGVSYDRPAEHLWDPLGER